MAVVATYHQDLPVLACWNLLNVHLQDDRAALLKRHFFVAESLLPILADSLIDLVMPSLLIGSVERRIINLRVYYKFSHQYESGIEGGHDLCGHLCVVKVPSRAHRLTQP